MTTSNGREPVYGAKKFTCPHCGAFAEQRWYTAQHSTRLFEQPGPKASLDARLHISHCQACNDSSYWRLRDTEIGAVGRLIWPGVVTAPTAHPDMPDDVRQVYEEARNVAPHSARAAAGLLRLALQQLLLPFAPGQTKLDKAIQAAVDQGLAGDVAQMAMDVLRVNGNDSVHPSELTLDEDPELLPALFSLLNVVVDRLIGEPARIAALYAQIPESKRDAILRRSGRA